MPWHGMGLPLVKAVSSRDTDTPTSLRAFPCMPFLKGEALNPLPQNRKGPKDDIQLHKRQLEGTVCPNLCTK
jgi:hypothetical protein